MIVAERSAICCGVLPASMAGVRKRTDAGGRPSRCHAVRNAWRVARHCPAVTPVDAGTTVDEGTAVGEGTGNCPGPAVQAPSTPRPSVEPSSHLAT